MYRCQRGTSSNTAIHHGATGPLQGWEEDSAEESRTAFIHQMPVSTMDQFLSTTLRENSLNSNYTVQVKEGNPSDMFHVKAKG